MDELKLELKNLVARNKIRQALQKMGDLPTDQQGGLGSDIIALQARLKDHTRNSNMGTIDPMTASTQKSQIVVAVLAVIDGLGHVSPDPALNAPVSPAPHRADGRPTTILFLAANPVSTDPLRLGEEHREIDEALIRANHGGSFQLKQGFATTTTRLLDDLLTHTPNILHFSGHGVKIENQALSSGTEDINRSFLTGALIEEEADKPYTGGIILEDGDGNPKLVQATTLARLVRHIGGIELIFLNACYSEVQANALLECVPYVIGMNTAVPDKTAVQFAASFYRALGAKRSYEQAFHIGISGISLDGMPGTDIPVFRSNPALIKPSS